MPRKKRTSKLRPKTPSRIKKRRPARTKPRSLQHPELWGLGLVALGAFLGSVIYFGWNGGYVGGALADGLDSVVGRASWGLPVLLVVLGCLMVARSALVDVRPFRTGLAVLVLGLMIVLGRDQGGYLGQMLGGGVGLALGATGTTILGILLLLVGTLLLTGASLGAILRRSGHGMKTAAAKARAPAPRAADARRLARSSAPPPGLVHDAAGSRSTPRRSIPTSSATTRQRHPLAVSPLIHAEPAPLVAQHALVDDPLTLFDDVTSEHVEYRLPDASVLRRPPRRPARRRRPRRASPTCSSRRSRTSASTRTSSGRSPARASRATSCSSRRARRWRRSRR